MSSHLEDRFETKWREIGGPPMYAEFKFHPTRKWRFDFAHPASRTAVEIEGATWAGGRHSRGSGYAADCEKYNAAGLAGWTVFRLTGGMVDADRLKAIKSHIAGKMPIEGKEQSC